MFLSSEAITKGQYNQRIDDQQLQESLLTLETFISKKTRENHVLDGLMDILNYRVASTLKKGV